MNGVPLLQQTSFILCFASALILMTLTERVSVFDILRLPISIIQKTVNCIESVINNTTSVPDTKKNLWNAVCSQYPTNYSNGIHTLPFTLKLCYAQALWHIVERN